VQIKEKPPMVFNIMDALPHQNRLNRFSVNRLKPAEKNRLNRFFVFESNASYPVFGFSNMPSGAHL